MEGSADLSHSATFELKDVENPWCSVSDVERLAPTSHGYRFWLQGKESGNFLCFCLRAEACEGCAGYSVLIDFQISVFRRTTKLDSLLGEYELVTKDSHLSSLKDHPCWLPIPKSKFLVSAEGDGNANEAKEFVAKLDIKVREVLCGRPENLHEEGPYRDFALLVQDTAFYVNVNYLADLGSPYFQNMADCRQKGVRRTVLLNRSPEELKIFFDAICTYRKPVITRANFDFVIQFAKEFKVAKALRACELYLIDSKTIHPIRKLEFAAEFGLGILGDSVIRQLGSGLAALDKLHEYCNLNGESIDQIHPDVLDALDIQDEFVVL